jgi:hypothetical protein
VSNEDTAAIHEKPEFLVDNLEGCECVPGQVRIQVANWSLDQLIALCQLLGSLTLDAGELRQVVYNHLARMDMVVDERNGLLVIATAED